MYKINCLLLIIITLTSCSEDFSKSYLNKNCETNTEFRLDSISKSITYNMQEHYSYLSINPINKRSDTFFLRSEKSDKYFNKILEFSFYEGIGQVKIYRFPLAADRKILFDKTKENLENFTTHFKLEKDWKKFIVELKRNKILELPDSKQLKGYFDEEPQSLTVFEYSNNCRYQVLIYPDLEANSKRFKEAQYLASFLTYLKEDFDF